MQHLVPFLEQESVFFTLYLAGHFFLFFIHFPLALAQESLPTNGLDSSEKRIILYFIHFI